MGHSRPRYNSAVSTFCWAVANDEKFTVNDRNAEVLLYIDDLVEGMYDLLVQDSSCLVMRLGGLWGFGYSQCHSRQASAS